jgi:hypothetical protein
MTVSGPVPQELSSDSHSLSATLRNMTWVLELVDQARTRCPSRVTEERASFALSTRLPLAPPSNLILASYQGYSSVHLPKMRKLTALRSGKALLKQIHTG